MSPRRTEHKILFIAAGEERRAQISGAFARASSVARLVFASTPEAGIDVVRRETVDAVFFDHARCGMDAFEIMARLETAQRTVPVVMMTEAARRDIVLQALRDGAFECVSVDAVDTYPSVSEEVITRFEAAHENAERSRAILHSQKQWMSIIDAITDHIFVLDRDRILIKVNNSFAASIGKHPRDVVGSRLSDIVDLELPADAVMKDVLESGTPRIYEQKINDEIFQISIFPLREDSQPLTIHVMKNITEVRRLKDQLYHADKLASIGLLVSGVAHEINNPLTGTIAYTELLSMKVTDESVKAELRKILDSAERCKKIVDNLLTFSRQRTPSKSLETVNDIIDRAIDLRNYWLKSHNIQIVREYDPVSTVFVDAQQIQQVILNLLLNAEQAIVAAGQTKGRVRFATRLDKANRRIVITVSDNGPGIPQKVAAKIFDPFFTTKPVGIGTGLGLSIAHGIVTEHGGTIRYEPAGEGGASFTIELPTGTDRLPAAVDSSKKGRQG